MDIKILSHSWDGFTSSPTRDGDQTERARKGEDNQKLAVGVGVPSLIKGTECSTPPYCLVSGGVELGQYPDTYLVTLK